ncbi:unnamed protein product, partial [Strongylus vulgaris]
FRYVVVLTVFIRNSEAILGFDTAQAIPPERFKCLQRHNYSFFIARVYRSLGSADPVGIQNIKNARIAGWTDIDAYIFPCLRSRCSPPEIQVKDALYHLKHEGVEVGTIWLDIEVFMWPDNVTYNRNFIDAMGNFLNETGIKWGIYTNNYHWRKIVGIEWNKWASKPLWWPSYNKHQVRIVISLEKALEATDAFQNFTGFVPFGGWKKPYMHQYAGLVNVTECGVTIDFD